MENIPYAQEFKDYLDVESEFAPSTQDAIMLDLRILFFFLQLEYFDETVDITEIASEHIRGFLHFLKVVRDNSAVTRNRKLASVNIYFSFLKSGGYLGRQKNPARGLRYAKKPRNLPVYLTQEEAEKILMVAPLDSPTPFRDLAIMRLFLQTACRLQELVQLRHNNVFLNERLVKYNGKGNVERIVPLTDKTVLALNEHMERRLSVYEYVPEIFLNHRGKPLGKRGVQLLFHRIRERARIDRPGLSVHKLRHTSLTLLLRQGVDIAVLQEIAGHADIGSTEIYLHVVNEDVRQAMDKHPLG